MAAVWLFFLSSAFWGNARVHLKSQLRRTADPEAEHQRELNAVAIQVEGGQLAAYGIAGWRGPMAVAGWARSGTNFTSLELAHYEDGPQDAPVIEIGYYSAPPRCPRRAAHGYPPGSFSIVQLTDIGSYVEGSLGRMPPGLA